MRCDCLYLCVERGLFISLCAQEFLYYPNKPPSPRPPPTHPPIYLASLQRPYTQHASQSHLEFFTCSLQLLTSLFPPPSSLRQKKPRRDQKVRRGAKSLCRVSIWPRFQRAVLVPSHENRHTGKHAHTVSGNLYVTENLFQGKTCIVN